MRSIALLFLLVPVLGWSQNLVPNPSFEEYEECPVSFGELEICTTNWKSWQESPDYYNVCNNSINGNLGVPQNNQGYQEPILGSAYAGIFTYSNYGQNVREYAATALQSPLIIGQSYYVMFYVSDVEGEGDNFPGEYKCSTNHLGLRFFKNPSYNNSDNILYPDNFAHVDFSEVIVDSTNWVKVEGWFTADDSYNWVAIGNFFEDDQTTVLVQNSGLQCNAIYYLENICVSADPSDCDYLLNVNESATLDAIQIFPNPVASLIRIYNRNHTLINVSIYDSFGRAVFNEESSNEMSIPSDAWTKGFYYVVLRDKSNSIKTFKLLKE